MAKWNQEIQNVDYRMGELKNQEKNPFLFQHKHIQWIILIILIYFRSIFKYNIADYYIKSHTTREWVN
jgi:hypothetical protein